MTPQNCFPGCCAVRNLFLQIFFSFSFRQQRCAMCNLNSNGDSTIKLLDLDLFYNGAPRFCTPNLSRFKMSYLSSFEILKNIFPLSKVVVVLVGGTISISALKHTHQLLGMDSTLRMRATISPQQWKLFRPLQGESKSTTLNASSTVDKC